MSVHDPDTNSLPDPDREALIDAASVCNIGNLVCAALPYHQAHTGFSLIRAYLESIGDAVLETVARDEEGWFAPAVALVPVLLVLVQRWGEEPVRKAMAEEASHILRRRLSEAAVASMNRRWEEAIGRYVA